MVFSVGQLKLIASYHHCCLEVTLEVQQRFGGMCGKLQMGSGCGMLFDIRVAGCALQNTLAGADLLILTCGIRESLKIGGGKWDKLQL